MPFYIILTYLWFNFLSSSDRENNVMDAFEKKQTTKALSVGILYYIYIYTSFFLPSDNIFNGKSMKMTNFFAIFLSTRRKSRKYEEKYQKNK